MTHRSQSIFAALLLIGAAASPTLRATDGHAADDELALAAAQLTAKTSTPVFAAPKAPAGTTTTATIGALAVDPANCTSNGAWGGAISWTPHIPVSAANLPDGRVLTFASNQRTSFPGGPEFTYAATWNPATGAFQEFNNGTHDMFCGGITLMPDGRVMVNGGRNQTPYTSIFDWRTNTWTRVQNMNGGRWYNTSVSTPSGEVFTATGTGTGLNSTERWNSSGWTLLTGYGWPAITAADPGYMKEWHPFISVAPDGRLLHFGPTDTMHYFNISGLGSFTNANATVPGAHYPKEGCWVMYDEGKVIVAGGGANTTASAGDTSVGISTNVAYTVNMTTSPPTAAPTASMQYPRQFANTVVLPSGEVLVIGGNSPGLKFSDAGSILPCEIWNPKTGTWRTVASITVPRNYHSVALLLPDGRVLSGGGGLGGGDHQDAQLYTPPCLFTSTGTAAVRPVLNTAPTKIGPGSTFAITATGGLAKFAFIRMAALTHSVNTDQRYLSLPFTETTAGNYQLTAHTNLNVMVPGYWMLFGINSTGAYSVAKIIQVDATAGLTLANPGDQTSNVGSAVSLAMSATAPVGTTLTYSATGLPAGLTINASTGVITGLPTTSGSNSVRVTATGGGLAVSQDFIWTVLLTNTGTGKLLREWWLNIPNADLNSLTTNTAYPNSPTGSDQITSFAVPLDWADNLGQRVRGYVIPPVTGQYRFWIASDDEGRLILSTNNSPTNGSIIAKVTTWTPSNAWTTFPEQASALITLQAGQPYYIEALMKEGAGGDNLSVAWQIPGSGSPVIIAGQYLSPWINNSPPTITNPGNRTNVVGTALSLNVTASDVNGDVLSYSATGLPTGLTINSTTGIISGTPTATGTFNATISVTDNKSPAVTASLVWTINPVVDLGTPPVAATSVPGTSLSYTITSTGGLNVRYKWTWGDGTPDSALSATTNATHTFTAPGRYQISVTATDDTGRITTATFYQGISAPLTAKSPTASSSIIYEDRPVGSNARLWSVNQDNNSVTVFDAVTRSRLAEIPVGTSPRTLALAPNGSVWVTNVDSGTISIISGSTLAVTQTLTLARGSRPYGVAFSPSGADAWITTEGTGQLLRMNPSTGSQVAALNIGTNARHVSVSADSARVFVTRFITPLLPGENTAVVSPTSTTGGEVFSVLTSTFALEKKTILLHSDRSDTITTGRGIPNYLGPAIVSPDGLTAWVPSKQDNVKRGMLRDGSQLTHDQTIRSIASRIPLTSGSPAATDDATNRVDFDNAGIAVNAAFESKGIYLFTALEGSREVGVVDVWNKKEIARFSAGRAPQGIAVSPNGRTIYVQNFMDRNITVHDVGAIIDGRTTTPTLTATLSNITTERLAANVLLGKKHFYDSADRRIAFEQYISCASCHNDGGQDGRVWDFTGFGEGLRNTIGLRGHAGTAQGPVHWTGNFDEIQDFENQIHTLPQGTGLIAGGTPNPPLGAPNAGRSIDLDSLADYVSSLSVNDVSPSRNSDGTLTASAVAGKAVFVSNACANCHSGNQFTDSAVNVLHDVGTLKAATGTRLGAAITGLDTPTLRGIWNTGPYLHDGSAATLAAAITAHTTVPRPATGTQAMTDLVNYLLQVDDGETSANRAPTITTPATQTSVRGAVASLQIVASDLDGNTLTYSATGLPSGLTIGSATGLISGTVGTSAAAANAVVVTVSDGSLNATASFTWNTTAPVVGPALTGSDIGTVAAAGSSSTANGVYTVKGSGDNIFYNADTFQFDSTAVTGDADIRARLTSMSNTGPWAKAGVMIRETAASDSRHAMLYSTPLESGNGYDMIYRMTTGGVTTDTYYGNPNPAPNNWMRLTRVGNVISSYVSTDGNAWKLIDAITFTNLPATMLYGLGVTSYNDGTLCTATFDNVQIITGASGGGGGLSGTDIGKVAAAGSTSNANGVYTVNGSGDNIFFNADNFQFASTAMTGDTDIRARLTSMSNTGPWAKAGVMIRETGASNSRHAMLYSTPLESGNGYDMIYRTATAGSTADTYYGNPNPAPNNWMRLTRVGNVISSYVSKDGTAWTLIDAITFTNLPATMLYGLGVTSYNDGTLCTATFDNVQVTSGASSGSGLSGTDIGKVGAAGTTSSAGGVYTVKGSGDNIFYNADTFQFASTAIAGDADIRARLTSMSNTGPWAKAGVMIRETGASNSRHAMLYSTPLESGNGYDMIYRMTTGGVTTDTYYGNPNPAPNNWMRLTRAGNVISSYVSADGSAWTLIDAVTFTSLPTTMLYGLGVTSYNDGTLCTATFDNVQISSSAGLAPLAARATNAILGTVAGSTVADPAFSATTLSATGLGATRPAGSKIQASLQVIDDLSLSPAGWRASAQKPTITTNADGTETLGFSDLSTTSTANQGFARVHIEEDIDGDGFADKERNGEVFGFNRRNYSAGVTTFSTAFALPALASAQVTAAQDNVVTLNTVIPALKSGSSYYLEVISGVNQGHRFDLDSATATVGRITVKISPRNTLAALPSSLVGDSVVIRPHQTLSALLPERLFTGGTSSATADRVMFYNGTGYETLWMLRLPSGVQRWVKSGDATLANAGGRVVDVVEGAMLQVRASITITTSGIVRANRIAVPLRVGSQLIANVTPGARSLTALGMTASSGFVAASSATASDRVDLLASDDKGSATGFRSIAFLTVGPVAKWTEVGDATLTSLNTVALITPMHSFFVKSTTAKPGFMIPAGWQP